MDDTKPFVPFVIGTRTYEVPVPMSLLALKTAWPHIQAVETGINLIDDAASVCGVVAAGMMLSDKPPAQRELEATLTADQIKAVLVQFTELVKRCGLELTLPGEASRAGTTGAVPIGTESSSSSPSTV